MTSTEGIIGDDWIEGQGLFQIRDLVPVHTPVIIPVLGPGPGLVPIPVLGPGPETGSGIGSRRRAGGAEGKIPTHGNAIGVLAIPPVKKVCVCVCV